MIEVYWANTQDGKRRSVEFAEDDERIAQAFGTWLASTDGIVSESVRVALPEQRGAKGQHAARAIADEAQLDSASEAYKAMIAAHDAVCSDRGCDPMTMGIFRDGIKPGTPEGADIARSTHARARLDMEEGEPTEQPDERYRELVGKRVRVTLDHPRAIEGILVGIDRSGGVSVFTAADGLCHGWPCLAVEALTPPRIVDEAAE